MKIALILIASTIAVFSASASAQQSETGTITAINRLSGTVSITPNQSATVGSNTPTQAPAAAEQYKVEDGALLESVHAGDRVTFSVGGNGGARTITKLDRQK